MELLTVALTEDGGFGIPISFGCNVTTEDGELNPTALIARTLNEYDTPPESLVIVADRYVAVVVAAVFHVAPASVEDSSTYPVTTLPPFDAGVLHDRYAVLPERNPEMLRGALATDGAGGVATTTLEATLSPTAFTAVTRNICEVPPAKLEKTKLRVTNEMAARFHVAPESVEYWATYPVIAVPPLVLGVDQYNEAAL